MTFMLEVIAAVRSAVGPTFPVVFRICSSDLIPGGNTNIEACQIAAAAEEAGVDAIHVTGGWHEAVVPQATMDVPHGAFAYYGKRIKEFVNIPVIICNRMDIETAENVLYEGMADYISFARHSLADPEMPRKAAEGYCDRIRPCVGCNQGCLDMRMRHRKISCLVNAEVGREVDLMQNSKLPTQTLSPSPEDILVVGSGPAGMEFARVAALRGHKVSIWEKNDHVGGQFELNSAPPGRHDFALFGQYLERECRRLGVNIELNHDAAAEEIIGAVERGEYDRVVIATGASPAAPQLPVEGTPDIQLAWDVLRRKKKIGKRVVIVGGGAVGVETGEFIAKMGTISPEIQQFLMTYDAESPEGMKDLMFHGTKDVTIVEMGPRLGADIGPTTRWSMMARLKKHSVKMLKLTKVVAIGTDHVELEDSEGVRTTVPADTVVLAIGSRPVNGLYKELENKVEQLTIIGDAVKPAFIIDAVRAAYDAASIL